MAKAEYSVNLKAVFDRAYSNSDVAVRSQLRRYLNDNDLKRVYADRVLERIITRTTQNNVDKDNNRFAPYSEAYIDSDDFAIYGKSASDVNLTLSGEMLASLEAEVSSSSITIKLADNENKEKALGHINGTRIKRGKNAGKKHLPRRDFLGLPPEEEERILQSLIQERQAGLSTFDIDLAGIELANELDLELFDED